MAFGTKRDASIFLLTASVSTHHKSTKQSS